MQIEQIKQKISTAAQKAGKTFDDIAVVCATKTRDIDTIKKIKDWGFCFAGENRVQELLSKYEKIDGISWQIVGQLQSNKVKYIADKVDMIQSLDRQSLAKEIETAPAESAPAPASPKKQGSTRWKMLLQNSGEYEVLDNEEKEGKR